MVKGFSVAHRDSELLAAFEVEALDEPAERVVGQSRHVEQSGASELGIVCGCFDSNSPRVLSRWVELKVGGLRCHGFELDELSELTE
jgi:hypothetical protein